MLLEKETPYECDICGKKDFIRSENIFVLKHPHEKGLVSYITLCKECGNKLVGRSILGGVHSELNADEFYDVMSR